MEFYIFMGCVIAILAAIPFLRIFFKRLSMKRRLTRACREGKGTLHPAHRYWFLGRKMGKQVDFYIETAETVYAVKLFAAKKRSRYLIFTDDGMVYSRKFLNLIYRYGTGPRFFRDTKPKKLPDYDFYQGFCDEWKTKDFCSVLLLNPTCVEVHRNIVNKNTILANGEEIAGKRLYTLSGLIDTIRRSAR